MSAAGNAIDAGVLRHRQASQNVNGEDDNETPHTGCDKLGDEVTEPKAQKTFGRTPDGTSKYPRDRENAN